MRIVFNRVEGASILVIRKRRHILTVRQAKHAADQRPRQLPTLLAAVPPVNEHAEASSVKPSVLHKIKL